jgi:hypothetical protein
MQMPIRCQHCQFFDLSDLRAAADGVGWCRHVGQFGHAATERRCDFYRAREFSLHDNERRGIDPAAWLTDWQIAQREARRLLRRARRMS